MLSDTPTSPAVSLALALAALVTLVCVPREGVAQTRTRPRRATAQQPAPATKAGPPGQPTSPQEVREVGEDEVVRVTTNEVLLPVTVRDASGALVTTLRKTDFKVWEDGREQALSDVKLRQVPVDVALLIDTSSSTAENFEDFRRAAADFAARLGPEDRVCLLKFDDRVELLQDWTSSPVQLRRSLARITPGMFTRFNEALYLAAREQLRPTPSRRRAVVVLSDGIDSGRGGVPALDALKAMLESQATVYVISNTEIQRRRKQGELDTLLSGDPSALRFNALRIGDLREGLRVLEASEAGLARLCGATGGRLYRPESFGALADLYREIADELRHQYALYYSPLNGARDGGFRRVRVEVPAPGMQVATRVGYYAPR